MTDIISIETMDFGGEEVQVVSARTLFSFLVPSKKNYTRWIKEVIVGNGVEGIDYILGGHPNEESSDEYILTIDFAKTISMMSKSKKGKEVRQYFLDVEKSFKKIVDKKAEFVPKTYIEALEAQIELVKRLEAQGQQLETASKTIERLTHTGKLYTATEIAKELGLRSAEQMNKQLEEMQIQYKSNNTWVLRSWYADKGYTSIKQMELDNGRVIYDRKWTQLGREFLLGKFKETKMLVAGE